MSLSHPTINLIAPSPIKRTSRTTTTSSSTPIRPLILIVGKTISHPTECLSRTRTNSQDSWASDDTLVSKTFPYTGLKPIQIHTTTCKNLSLTEEEKRIQRSIREENKKNHTYCNELRHCGESPLPLPPHLQTSTDDLSPPPQADCDKLYPPRRKTSIDQLEFKFLDERFAKTLESKVVELKKTRSFKGRMTTRTKKILTTFRSVFCGGRFEKELGREGREYEWEEEKRFYQYDELRDEKKRWELEVASLLREGEINERDLLGAKRPGGLKKRGC